jgi:PAS domain S-box-containing protein
MYRRAISAADGVVYQLDFRSGAYTFMGEGIERLLGYPPKDVTPELWKRIGTLDRLRGDLAQLPLAEAVRRYRAGESPVWKADYRVMTKQGETRWISDSSVLLHGPKGKAWGCMGILQDVSDRRRLEDRLREAEKMEAIGKVAGGIAHDFNNLLAGVSGFAEMIAANPGDAQVGEWAQTIVRAVGRTGDLTGKLLAFARKGKYVASSVDLHSVIADVVGLLEKDLDRRISVRRELSPGPLWVSGDPAQIQNALLNLAVNARDALPDGGEIRFTTEELSLDEAAIRRDFPELSPGPYVRIAVADTGVGMDEEIRRHLFEPFFTTKTEGAGLGLAAVYGAARNHRGSVRVQSSPGRGSTFSFYLPKLVTAAAGASAGGPASGKASPARILVVDDEEIIRRVVSQLLTKIGHRVLTCNDGQEAVDLYRDSWGDIDLVILDIVMPRLGGLEAFRLLRRINPSARVLVLSGFSVEGEAQSILDEGALGFMQKPFRLAELSEKVETCLKAPAT